MLRCCLTAVSLAASSTALRSLRRTALHFAKTRPAGLWNDKRAPTYDSSQPLKVAVWNVQYCAGIEQHYFYDGGTAVGAPLAAVEHHTAAIGDAIAALDADVVMLQEVDRRSRRTHYVDEFDRLRKRLAPEGLTCAASAAYWRVPYVPHPKHEHVGRIGMHLATFSRFRLKDAVRHQLPLLKESRVRRLFNIRRAVLETPLENGPALFNTHLSAFSKGDGTVEKQVARVRELAGRRDDWLLAGDFNALTPYEDAAALPRDEAAYQPGATPAAPLYDGNALWASPAARKPTYKPWTEPAPDRTVDHAFASSGAAFSGIGVAETAGGFLSDHQPVVFEVGFAA